MFTPETLRPEFVRALAHDLHRRQVLNYLAKAGFTLRGTGAPASVAATDAEGRSARVDFHSDGAFSVSTEDGRRLTRRFDENGALEELSDKGGLRVTMRHGAHGSRHIAREGRGEFIVGKDPYGLPHTITYPDGGQVRFDFEADGGETVTDQMGHVSQARRNKKGEIVGVTDRNGHTTHIEEGTAEDGTLWTLTTPVGRTHEYHLDPMGDLAQWRLNGFEVARYSGRQPNGLPEAVRFHDGYTASFETVDDRIVTARNPGSTVRFTYDKNGHLSREDQNGIVVSYERDRTGLLTAIVLPDGERTVFQYDTSGRLSAIRDWTGAVTQVSWAPTGQIAAIRHPNGVATTVASDALGLVTAMRTESPASAPVQNTDITYDACDRVVEMREDGASRQFCYDSAGRLTDARSSDPAFSESWQLDPMGNRVLDNGARWTADPDNGVSGPGELAIAYDALGRTRSAMTPQGRANFHYNGQGHLTHVELATGTVAEYAYDALGRRISKRVGTVLTRYLWAGQTMICEWTEGGGPWRRRDHLFLPGQFLPLAMRVDGRIYRQHCDHRGAPQSMTDERGAIAWRARLKAFGAAMIAQRSVDNPWRLTNQYCDDETGLHYNLARYHHPSLGRYLTPDPMFDPACRGNLYVYAANDPLNRADPTGEILPLLIAAGVGGAVGAGIGAAVKAYELRNDPRPWSKKIGEVGKAALVGGIVGAVGGATGFGVASLLGTGAGVGAGALSGIATKGGIEGAISSVAETCAEAGLEGKPPSPSDVLISAVVGGGIGALTAGIGGKVAARAARKERMAAKELAEQAEKEAAERAAKKAEIHAGKTPIQNLPNDFVPSVDDGTKRALNAFPHTKAGQVARDLDGKSLADVKSYMDSSFPNAKREETLLKPLASQDSNIKQTKWELPDGTVIRVKETIPPGGKVDKFRQEPALSVGAVKRDAAGLPMSENFANEAFKVSKDGIPIPKGPSDVNTDGMPTSLKNEKIDSIMQSGHITIRR